MTLNLADPETLLEPLSEFIDDDMRVTTMALVNKSWHKESLDVIEWMTTHPGLTYHQRATIYPGLTLPSNVVAAVSKTCVLCKGRYDHTFDYALGCYTHRNCLQCYLHTNGTTQRFVDDAFGYLPCVAGPCGNNPTQMKWSVVHDANNAVVPWHQTHETFRTSQATMRQLKLLRCGLERVHRRYPDLMTELEELSCIGGTETPAMNRDAVLNTTVMVMSMRTEAEESGWRRRMLFYAKEFEDNDEESYVCPLKREAYVRGLRARVSLRVWEEYVMHASNLCRYLLNAPVPVVLQNSLIEHVEGRVSRVINSSINEESFLESNAVIDKNLVTVRRIFPRMAAVNPKLLHVECMQEVVATTNTRAETHLNVVARVKWLIQLQLMPEGLPLDIWDAVRLVGLSRPNAFMYASLIMIALQTVTQCIHNGTMIPGLRYSVRKVAEVLAMAGCQDVPEAFRLHYIDQSGKRGHDFEQAPKKRKRQ